MVIKNASSIILIRKYDNKSFVLMGKRNSKSKFMPNKLVFPGGGWEKDDSIIAKNFKFENKTLSLLNYESDLNISNGLVATAIRELWEETGLRLASNLNDISEIKDLQIPILWKEFCKKNYFPNLNCLNFFFRAITPPGRKIRFDARFFICDSKYLVGKSNEFKSKNDELIDLSWISLDQICEDSLPRITKRVIKQVKLIIKDKRYLNRIPFYKGGSEKNTNNFITYSGVKFYKT